MPHAIPSQSKLTISKTERIFPSNHDVTSVERVVPLSLLDATTSNFGLTSAIWLFASPATPTQDNGAHMDFKIITTYLRQCLGMALNSYPQWCGQVKAITTLIETELPSETSNFPHHARRFGRLYTHFNTPDDPGVELISATSSLTVESLYQSDRTPIWIDGATSPSLKALSPSAHFAKMLTPHNFTHKGVINPVLAIQITELSSKGGGRGDFVLAVKAAHPMADITAMVQFVKHWATLTQSTLSPSNPMVPLSAEPVFDPSLLDSQAAGNINADKPSPSIITDAKTPPFHRFDTWIPGTNYPEDWPSHVPPAFKPQLTQGRLKPTGTPMPWSEWDVTAPVSTAVLHFTREQVNFLYQKATTRPPPQPTLKTSKHDALLSHIWTRIVSARNLHPNDHNPIHCNLVLGVRPALNLPPTFQGSPIVMVNIASTPSQILADRNPSPTTPNTTTQTTNLIRSTISNITTNKTLLHTHLHNLAYETSPQRIWQAFLGNRHIIVTTWAKAGIYDVDFGLGHGPARYADGDLPVADGFVLIKEAPPSPRFEGGKELVGGSGPVVVSSSSWTGKGVDVTVNLKAGDMERLLGDELLLPGRS